MIIQLKYLESHDFLCFSLSHSAIFSSALACLIIPADVVHARILWNSRNWNNNTFQFQCAVQQSLVLFIRRVLAKWNFACVYLTFILYGKKGNFVAMKRELTLNQNYNIVASLSVRLFRFLLGRIQVNCNSHSISTGFYCIHCSNKRCWWWWRRRRHAYAAAAAIDTIPFLLGSVLC